jgi:hypothetical protein
MYLLADLKRTFHARTIRAWVDAGLPICRPGTRFAFVLSDDLIELWKTWTPRKSPSSDAPDA